MHHYTNSGWAWASPEYTRDRKRFYIYILVCLWGDHFSEERVKFWTRKVMVVMRIRPHFTMYMCTRSERQLRPVQCRQRHKTWKVSAVPLWQGSGPRLTSLVDSTFLSMKMCFQRNLVTYAKARPAQIIFITTSITTFYHMHYYSVMVHVVKGRQ